MKLLILLVVSGLIADSLQSRSTRPPSYRVFDNTPLHSAASSGTVDEVRELIEQQHADMTARLIGGVTPFHLAVDNKDVNVAKVFIENNIDVDIRTDFNITALHLAAQKDNLMLAKVLLDAGADVNATDLFESTPLHLTHRKEMVKLLLEHNANVNAIDDGDATPIWWAFWGGKVDPDIIRLLVQYGANINVSNRNGDTPLHKAAFEGDVDIIKYLIESGADLTAKNSNGESAFHIAIRNVSVPNDTLQAFIDHHQALNITDNFGYTPLHHAAAHHNFDAVRLLISYSADVNARDKDGNSPLHIAALSAVNINASYEPKELFQLLLDSGADANATDSFGNKPCELIKPRVGTYVSAGDMAIINERRAYLNCAALPHIQWQPIQEPPRRQDDGSQPSAS